ncbi:cwf18 pre-mRNA splicing factor-domain-containing protein [Lineolata rhizophorae]|uniref:Cwf18 pre-mRNA splicing factor-domain-containing protein n=1 Tax=Lineolata rhizophorae TaxID=578093 RepID=A0A6A6PDN3_9PEZI|nr:cwf18 pre-mRNA splicing factor-domain-containing protein [Lineolata rhizophorae]
MASHATLNAAAEERKARLAQLRSLKRKQPEPDTDVALTTTGPEDEQQAAAPTESRADAEETVRYLSGRNFDIATHGPKLGFEAQPQTLSTQPTAEQLAAQLAASVHAQQAAEEEDSSATAAAGAPETAAAANGAGGLDLFKLRPKKPNWDLKREMERKMAVLGPRTENAIARLVRERVEGRKAAAGVKGGGVSAVTAAAASVPGGKGGDAEMEGAMLVEAMHVREREDEEDAARDREEEDDAMRDAL